MPVGIYLQPHSKDTLIHHLSFLTENSAVVSGCTDFLAQRNGKVWNADVLLDLSKMEELRRIWVEKDTVIVGAGCTHTQLAENPLIQTFLPALAQAAGQIGSRQIRNRGTIGGNIANASPAGDTIVCAALYHAQAVVLGPTGEQRVVPAIRLADKTFSERLNQREVITAFRFAVPPCKQGCFIKLGERTSVTISRISLAAYWQLGQDRLDALSVWLGAINPTPVRVTEAERLCAQPMGETLHQRFLDTFSDFVNSTMAERPSKAYKSQAVRGLADSLYRRIYEGDAAL